MLGAFVSRARVVASRSSVRSFSVSAAASEKVGFIGLGNMGKSMALNLIKAGHELSVFDLSSEACAALQSAGARVGRTAAEAAKGVNVVVTMLPSSPHVAEVYRTQVFGVASPNALLIDCSTIDPNVTRTLATEAGNKKLRMIDAPVSGGVGGAAAGTLTFMVGGTSAEFEAAKPVLQGMGKNIVHCGSVGTGQVAKICNNLILGISMNAVSEAMNLGVKLGADPKTLASIINTSSGRCWSSDTYNPVPGVMPNVPASREYAGGFGTALMLKDLGLAIDAARSVGAPLPTGAAAANTYTIMVNQGYAKKDFSAAFEFLGQVKKN